MIRFKSAPIELTSRLGRVGSIRAFDLWQFRESRQAMIEGVAQIASLSYGNEAAKNPQALFDRIIKLGHLSCLEFVPMGDFLDSEKHLPSLSVRAADDVEDVPFGTSSLKYESKEWPATGFLVECPIFVARQWMRHRAFSYLEMSRRYVKGEKVALEFYGGEMFPASRIYEDAAEAYQILLDSGEPPELARRVLPVGMMTKFYVGGFDRDWEHFVSLRSDAHAQAEIRAFSDAIAEAIA